MKLSDILKIDNHVFRAHSFYFGLKNRININQYNYECVYCNLYIETNESLIKDNISIIIKCLTEEEKIIKDLLE